MNKYKKILSCVVITTLVLSMLSTNIFASDLDDVEADMEELNFISAHSYAMYMDAALPAEGKNGSQITWKSSDEDYISIQKIAISPQDKFFTGVVNRPKKGEGDVGVTLTATIRKGDAERTKTFAVSVREKNALYEDDFQQWAPLVTDDADSVLRGASVSSGEAHTEIFRGVNLPDGLEDWSYDSTYGTSRYFDRRIQVFPRDELISINEPLPESSKAGTKKAVARVVNLTPPKVEAQETVDGVVINWLPVDGADGYAVYKKTASISTVLLTDVGSSLEHNIGDSNLQPGEHQIVVRAYKNSPDGEKSKSSNAANLMVTESNIELLPPDENLTYRFDRHTAYGGGTTYVSSWRPLIDPETGKEPEGIILISFDVYAVGGNEKLMLGAANSRPTQMCRFSLNNGNMQSWDDGTQTILSGGTLRYWSEAAQNDYKGGTTAVTGYRHPIEAWRKATLVCNTYTQLWDFYYDGILIEAGLKFRNAEEFISSIEITHDRNWAGSNQDSFTYYYDNFYVENLTGSIYDVYCEQLNLEDIMGVDPDNLTNDFPLAINGTNGIRLNWTTSDESVINIVRQLITEDEDGNPITPKTVLMAQVIPDSYTGRDKQAVLTAHVTFGQKEFRKDFNVTVPKRSAPLAKEKIELDLASITSLTDGMTINTNTSLALPKEGSIHGSAIEWRSNNSAVISTSGVVTRPSGSTSNVAVVLTAVAQNYDVNGDGQSVPVVVSKNFTVFVVPLSNSGGSSGGGGRGSSGGGLSLVGTVPSNSPSATPSPTPSPTPDITKSPSAIEQSAQAIKFNDIEDYEWAKDAIEELAGKGVLKGDGNQSFNPDGTLTREQLVVMLFRAFKLSEELEVGAENTDVNFNDVVDDEYYSHAIKTAVSLGIINGISADTFGVGQDVSREDMAVMLWRVMELFDYENRLEQVAAKDAETFADDGSISDYAKQAVYAMKNFGIISGVGDNSFNPKGTATRAQAAKILYESLKETQKSEELNENFSLSSGAQLQRRIASIMK